jgi:hypothetical protein
VGCESRLFLRARASLQLLSISKRGMSKLGLSSSVRVGSIMKMHPNGMGRYYRPNKYTLLHYTRNKLIFCGILLALAEGDSMLQF